MSAARAYTLPAPQNTDALRRPLATLRRIAWADRIPAEAHSSVTSVMGPPNRAPGIAIMGAPDVSPRVDVMGGADHADRSLGVMGGPDLGPRVDVLGESDRRFVGFAFTG